MRELYKMLTRFLPVVVMTAAAGCGYIADKDRIVVAELDGEPVTRGDLEEVIREMPDDERPLIQNKGDLLRTLNQYIDEQITSELAAELNAENKIAVSREAAREAYFEKHPEFRRAYQIRDPAQLNMTEGDVNALKAEVEFGVDEEVERMLREQAVQYKMQEAAQNRSIQITPEEIRQAYELRKRQLIKPEFVEFVAIRFPAAEPGAIQRAAQARRRIDAGEAFDAVLESYLKQDPALGMRSALENDPDQPRFMPFWRSLHGAQPGQVYGPVLLPAHEQIGRNQDGRPVIRQMPAAHIVLKVIEHEPKRPMTLEEATNELAAWILRGKVMDRLREAHGVAVYPENLPNPAGYGNQYQDYVIDTGETFGSN